MLFKALARPLKVQEIASILDEEVQSIVQLGEIERVYLFGSAATNTMTDQSDLDFLVLVEDQSDLKSIKKRYYSRKKSHQWPVDIIFMRKCDFEEKSLLGGVAMMCRQEGQVLYGHV